MRKMKLDAETLAVQSFETSTNGAGAAGTVHARQDAVGEPKTPGRLGTCYPGICTCDGLPTCDVSGCYPCPPSDPMVCPKPVDDGGQLRVA